MRSFRLTDFTHSSHEYHFAFSEIQSSFALTVSFTSPISRLAQDDISAAAGAGAIFGLGLRVSCSPSGSGEAAAGAGSGAGRSSEGFPVGDGVSAVHEARNTAPRRYLMAFSLVPTGR